MNVLSFHCSGVSPEPLHIEFNARFQIPGFQILGLPAPEIQEARERIISAFQSSGFEFPKKKVIINLSPASVRKSGTGHDLAIALKILSECHPAKWPESLIAWGELALDGAIRPAGKMAHLIEFLLCSGSDLKSTTLILGSTDYFEFLRLIAWRQSQGFQNPTGLQVLYADQLKAIPDMLTSSRDFSLPVMDASLSPDPKPLPGLLPLGPFQERIVKLGCLGRHHVLILGPKGVGKSASFEWFKALTPPPSREHAWERALFQESRSEVPAFTAPIRQVHSQVRPAHLLGSIGACGYRAGELSLAHGGILIADEFPEWPRDAKECLREPLQSERLHLTRTRGTLEVKSDIQLVGSGNLCPCGGFPLHLRSFGYVSRISCRCRETEVKDYLARISGPILDRIDLIAIFSEPPGLGESVKPSFEEIRRDVEEAREFALNRFGRIPSRLDPEACERILPKREPIQKLFTNLPSLRARHKIIRVACSIQALERASELKEEHLLESKSYRFIDSWF